jgi:hypothetical protein
VLPQSGSKTAQFLDVPLKPLNLHERIDALEPPALEALPLSSIQISGRFSVSDAYAWVANCIPDLPPNASSEAQVLSFRSTFVGTYLVVELSEGRIVVRSDNVSALTIVKVR